MTEVRETAEFKTWIRGLKDGLARAVINARIRRVSAGNFGDVEPVGGNVSELRINHGPGYRVYFTKRGLKIVILLCGGDKSSQARDIKAAKRIADAL